MIDTYGKLIYMGDFDRVDNYFMFCNKNYIILEKNKKKALLTSDGKQLTDFKYDNIDANLVSEIDDKNGLLDKNGKEIIPCMYDYLYFIRNNDSVLVAKFGDKVGLITIENKQITPFKYDDIGYDFYNKLVAKIGKIKVYLSPDGKETSY